MTIPCQAPMWEGVTTIGLSPSTLSIDTAMEVRTNSKNPALFVAFNVVLVYNRTITRRCNMIEWKKIKGFKNYSVSNTGNVRNDRTGRILKLRIGTTGYYQVMMGRKTIPQYVHRLVAIAFIANYENKPQVDHLDGNKLNNCVDNLRWVTASENCFGFGYQTRIANKQKKIIAKHADGRIMEFESRNQAAEFFKCDKSCISYGREFTKGNKKGWTLELMI